MTLIGGVHSLLYFSSFQVESQERCDGRSITFERDHYAREALISKG